MRVSRSPIREGVPKGRALQRCQSFFGRLVLLCQSGDLKEIKKGQEAPSP